MEMFWMQALNSESDLNFICMLKCLSKKYVTMVGRILQWQAQKKKSKHSWI